MNKPLMLALSLSTLLFANKAIPATMNAYKKVTINSTQVFSLDQFPYKNYFVCIRKWENGEGFSDYLQHDRLFQQALRKTAGEAAARQYRYLNEQPAKENIAATAVKNDSFYKKEQVPFINDQRYTYSWHYLTPRKSDYQYATQTIGMLKERFDFKTEKGRHWVITEPTFYRRSSDYEVKEDKRFSGLFILLSVNEKAIKQASSEQAAYQQAYQQTKAYYFAADPDNCSKR
ncbi:hypothetical protein [Motilimonas eburnea]|uniref:hypothetical protein n=1 Tax=Motilimonas eburnea TaxID=1737488 RepID=UPI001E406B96|nr:hypothetical protein [Motilimonas eburnea]MCE2571804.1 hypothetical protein [Motilimonas eburnea]